MRISDWSSDVCSSDLTAGLPWFGFWARELLRWGTHDPFVAFCLSQGLAQTREAAAQRRPAFETWLDDEIDDVVAEDRIDPQHFQQWQTSLARHEPDAPEQESIEERLTGTDGKNSRYAVVVVRYGDDTRSSEERRVGQEGLSTYRARW